MREIDRVRDLGAGWEGVGEEVDVFTDGDVGCAWVEGGVDGGCRGGGGYGGNV